MPWLARAAYGDDRAPRRRGAGGHQHTPTASSFLPSFLDDEVIQPAKHSGEEEGRDEGRVGQGPRGPPGDQVYQGLVWREGPAGPPVPKEWRISNGTFGLDPVWFGQPCDAKYYLTLCGF